MSLKEHHEEAEFEMKIIQILGTCALIMATHSWAVKLDPNIESKIVAKLVDDLVNNEKD